MTCIKCKIHGVNRLRMFFLIITILAFFKSVDAAYGKTQPLIKISTADNSLILKVSNDHLQQITYGQKISENDLAASVALDQVPALPVFGTNVSASGLRLKHADGNLTTDLIYKSHAVSKTGNIVLTQILLHDSFYPVNVKLCYKAYVAENIIEQWMEIDHQENGPLTIYDAASSSLSIVAPSYQLTYFNGDWSNETNIYQTILQPGILTLDSKEGVRTAQKTSPSFLLALGNQLDEDHGKVIGGSLAWPGNWQIQFDQDQARKLRVLAGMSSYASDYHLSSGKTFVTPSFLFTFSDKGAGEVTRRFHQWARVYGMSNGLKDRELVLNNWETTGMDFDQRKLAALMKDGGELGLDLFLLDDGWFGKKYPRNNDQQGLGDWVVNQSKLPEGLSGLIQEGKNHNLQFGLWVEPEMVNPKSELYEKHPNWALTSPHRPLDLQRNQLILDLTNPEVQDYILASLENILTHNPGISYLKWDCNRFLTNAWSAYLKPQWQSNLYVDYARGFLSVLSRFRKKHPDLQMMLCASGGGRMDFGSLKYFDEYWPSDNTNAHDRVLIQWGMNYFYPSIGFAGHVSEMGRPTSLKFRFDVAMAGKLGMDMQLSHLNNEERAFSKKAIETYKSIKSIVLQGDHYRLLSPYENNRAALAYVSKNQQQALVYCYLLKKDNGGDFSTVYLKGLKPDATYKLNELNKGSYSRFSDYEGISFSGNFLMENGVKFSMWNVDESVVFEAEQQ